MLQLKVAKTTIFSLEKKNSLEFSRTWNQVLFFRMKSWKFSQKKKKNVRMKDRNSSRHSLLGVACWVWRTLSMTEKVTQTLAVNILVSLFSNCICYYCCSVDRTLLAEEKKKKKTFIIQIGQSFIWNCVGQTMPMYLTKCCKEFFLIRSIIEICISI